MVFGWSMGRRLSLALVAASIAGPAAAGGDGSGADNPALLDGACLDCLTRAAEPWDPFYDIDWSIGLRGAYVLDSISGGELETIVSPAISLHRPGQRTSLDIDGGGDVALTSTGQLRVSSLGLAAAGSYRFDQWTEGAASADLSLTQAAPNDPNLPASTAIAPLVFTGDADASVTRRAGRFDVALRGGFGRTLEGPTTLDDASLVDNSSESYWRAGPGLRVGYELTPLLSAFIDTGVEWRRYDAASPSLLAYLDGIAYSARTGLAYRQNDTLSAEAAIGLTWLDYADPALADAAGVTYDGSVTVKPDETVSIVVALNSGIGPSSSTPGDTVISHTLSATGNILVVPWVTLRATAGVEFDHLILGGADQKTESAGIGVDYKLTSHVALTGDYAFTRLQAPPSPTDDTHTISLGVRYSR